jgi:sugar phosphate isomerase/epimerase
VSRQLGASTFAFAWRESALDALRRLQALGLDGFDVILAPGHLWPDELSPAARAALARTVAAEGIRIDSLNFPALDLNLASAIAEVRAYTVARYRDALALGGELGVRGVVAVPGRVSALAGPPAVDTERWLEESIGELLVAAEQADASLFLELHPQSPIPTVESLDRFVVRFDDSRLRVAYDVANAEFVREDHGEALRRLARRLGQVHLSDATASRWAHDRVGRGSVDFPAVLRALDEVGFDGACILEVVTAAPVEDIAASRDTLLAASGTAEPDARAATLVDADARGYTPQP